MKITRRNIHKKIYKLLIILVTLLILFVPKENGILSLPKVEKDIKIAEDGKIEYMEKLQFPSTYLKQKEIAIEYPFKEVGAENIEIYKKEITGERKIPVTQIDNKIIFEKGLGAGEYILKFKANNGLKKVGEKIAVDMALDMVYMENTGKKEKNKKEETKANKENILPELQNEENAKKAWKEDKKSYWVNEATIKIYGKKENVQIKGEEIQTLIYGLPTSGLQVTENVLHMNVTNIPKKTNAHIYTLLPKEIVNENTYKLLRNLELPNSQKILETQKEEFEKYKERKEQRDYSITLYQKYVLKAIYLLIAIQLVYYGYEIISVLITKYRNNRKINKKLNGEIDQDLLKILSIYNNPEHTDEENIVNMIKAVLKKLENRKIIEFEEKGIKILNASQKKIQELAHIDRYILEKIYGLDKENKLSIPYIQIKQHFRNNSQEIVYKIYEMLEYEKLKYEKEGGVVTKRVRVDFSIIIHLLPILLVGILFKYIDIFFALAIFVMSYTLAKMAVILSVDGYTKKGIVYIQKIQNYQKKLQTIAKTEIKDLQSNKKSGKLLKEKTKKTKKENNNDEIYKMFFGIKGEENRHLEEIAETITSYLKKKI